MSRNNNTTIRQPKAGQRFQVQGSSRPHNYKPGTTYRVSRVDPNDQTLIGIGPDGEEGTWINWADVKLVNDISWEWLQQNLPAEAVDLLSAFDGLSLLSLSEDVRNHIVLQTPDLRQRILDAQVDLEREEMNAG